MYNSADCTVNISDAEGFGLATLESLSCGTPIIVNMTGGLQEQVTDGEEWFGIGIDAASKAIIGSQEVPYIREDRLNKEDFLEALHKMYNMSKEERKKLGEKGAQHVNKNYNFEDFNKKWIELMDDIHERYGSWDTRKGYKSWEIKEIA
jgi:glycosyltransferase involved in cell wall biosynthesis